MLVVKPGTGADFRHVATPDEPPKAGQYRFQAGRNLAAPGPARVKKISDVAGTATE
jgi:hypothetical protein